MSEPEILRRCPLCGASARRGALFCPQCGNPTKSQGEGAEAAFDQRLDAPGELRPSTNKQTRKLDSAEFRVMSQPEKPRQAASVVLERASYDPSIRFLLVAVVLFVLFLVLLLLSKLIT